VTSTGALLRADAIVVGTGAGGGPAAAVLAEAGLEVLVLEAGARWETRDFDGEPATMLARLMRAATVPGSGMELYAGACVGGSTVVNDALCWRPPPEILARWRDEHGLRGLRDVDFAPYVDAVWEQVHATPTGPGDLSRNARLLERGAQRLGWAGEAMARNVRGCAHLGLCNLGCPTGAKQSALLTWVPRAERAGARVLPLVRAERVLVEQGRAAGIEARRLDPVSGLPIETLRCEAPLVVLATGVLETPALLLRSGIAAGDGVQFHSSVYVTARFAEPVHGFYGPTMSYAVTEFSDVHGRRGPGFMLENVTVAPMTTAASLPGFGVALERVMTALPHLARSVVVLRDETRGSVEIDGQGAAVLSYAPTKHDLERLRVAIRQLARLYLTAGAEEVWLPIEGLGPIRREADLAALDGRALAPRDFTLLYAVHLFGGAPMAATARTGTCDEAGRVWNVAGLFVSDASCLPTNTGANPQITIMANALRIAEGIAAESASHRAEPARRASRSS
jgi:choline dehydrogenase-like flavoprotein